MTPQHPAPTCDDRVRWSDESGRSRDPIFSFIKFREAVLAKAFRRTRGARAMKASRKAASGQKALHLPPGAPKTKIAASGLPTQSGGHSKGGAR